MSATTKVAISGLLCVGLIACAEHPSDQSNDGLSDIELRELSAVEATTLIKSKQITATQLVKAVISNAKRYKHLNAYITFDDNRALRHAALVDQSIIAGTASGRLLGVPLVIKDNIEVADMLLTIGTPSMKGIVPTRHAPSSNYSSTRVPSFWVRPTCTNLQLVLQVTMHTLVLYAIHTIKIISPEAVPVGLQPQWQVEEQRRGSAQTPAVPSEYPLH